MYMFTQDYYRQHLCAQPGETKSAFISRCTTGLRLIDPAMTEAEAKALVESGWAHNVLKNALRATVRLERDIPDDFVPMEDLDYYDWKIAEVLTAETATITYSALDTATAGSGDEFKIAKSVEEKQLLFGWANVAKDANGNYPIDWDGDVTAPEDLEDAAYGFVLKYRTSGEQHQEGSVVGQLVESMMFTKEKQAALGIPEGIVPEGWWVGFYIPDKEVFTKAKSGEYEMFSVEGRAKRVPTGQ